MNLMGTKIEKQLTKIIKNMNSTTPAGALLTGDPGIGKTSSIELLSKLTGIKTIVIEIPHIIEEHLINIPFITFDPVTNKSTGDSVSVDLEDMKDQASKGTQYQIQLAESNLLTKIKAVKKISDSDYLKEIADAPSHIQQLFMRMGGDEKTIPPTIQKARDRYNCILFLDEYYRQSSTRTRNILRGLLNRNIGMDKVPDSVYIIYASNMSDITHGAVEPVLSNEDWLILKHEAPTKEEWFDWFESKHEKNPRVDINPDVIKIFREHLTDDDINYTDRGVRISPRRWEQLMLYICASLPVENEAEAKQLLTNVKHNFYHYIDKHFGELSSKVMKLTIDAMKATSKMSVDEHQTLDDTSWRDTLFSLVRAQMKLGEYRKYIPIVSGPPGIGKTTNSLKIAHDLGLAYIPIEATVLNPESVIGIPLAQEDQEGNRKVHFSEPELYQRIMTQKKSAEKVLFDYWREQYKDDPKKAEQLIKEFPNKEWKYLIFFDEINRVQSTKVFNALRRIMLEKNFGPDEKGNLIKIPDGSIVVGAINPIGGATSQLTEHFRDVVDIIPAYGNWNSTWNYIKNLDVDASPDAKDAVQAVIETFVSQFKSKTPGVPESKKPFNLHVGSSEFYFSPREYESLYKHMVDSVDTILDKLKRNPEVFEDKIKSKEYVTQTMAEAFEEATTNSFQYKHGALDYQNIYNVLREWFDNLDVSVFGNLFVKRPTLRKSLDDVLQDYLSLKKPLKDMPEDEELINANKSVSHPEFDSAMKNVALYMTENDKRAQQYLLDQSHPVLRPNIEQGTFAQDDSLQVSFLANFLIVLRTTLIMHEVSNDRVNQVSSCRIKKNEIKDKLEPDILFDVVSAFVEQDDVANTVVQEATA